VGVEKRKTKMKRMTWSVILLIPIYITTVATTVGFQETNRC
jgi:hypothetical protein